MQMYIIYERDSWEITGIEKCFDSEIKAKKYLERYWFGTFNEGTFEDYCQTNIVTVTVE